MALRVCLRSAQPKLLCRMLIFGFVAFLKLLNKVLSLVGSQPKGVK